VRCHILISSPSESILLELLGGGAVKFVTVGNCCVN